jgi:hypothetical protein
LGFSRLVCMQDFLSIPPARYTGKAGEAPAEVSLGRERKKPQ